MAPVRLHALIRNVGRSHSTNSDADLLARFVATQDDGAFGELVRRYSRLVWGQCRHLLANEADADDAFQATFLALAKSAGSIRSTDRLGPWLHAVSHRVCLNARRAAARRTKRERGAASVEGDSPVADSTWDRAAVALHEEIHKLPESQRVAFVLCCIEGIAPTVAAEQLGLKWGTFSTRLSRAKQRLVDRLSARGFGAALAVGAVGRGAVASAALVEQAVLLGSGGTAIPASLLSLTTGVGGMLMRTKLTMAVAFAMLALGAASLVLPANRLPTALPVARAAPVPEMSKEDKRKQLESLWGKLVQRPPNRTIALLKLSSWPEKELLAFLSEKIKPLKLSQERAKELISALASEKIEVAEAAREEMSYFDPRLALTVEEMVKDVPEGLHRQRIFAVLMYSQLDTYLGCKLTYESSASLKLRNAQQTHAQINVDDLPDTPRKRGAFSTVLADALADMYNWQWDNCERGIIVLEHVGSPGAVKVLESMATGNSDAKPTQAAVEALGRLKNPRAKKEIPKRTTDEIWKSIGEDRAVLQLIARPEKEILGVLGEKLKPMILSKERAKKLLADLGDDKLTVAEAAFRELSYFDPRLAFTAEEIFNELPQGLGRQRIAAFFLNQPIDEFLGGKVTYTSGASFRGKVDHEVPSQLSVANFPNLRIGVSSFGGSVEETVRTISWLDSNRCVVGIVLLEHLGTPDAVKALETMATGHADASPTKAAKESLDRLKK